MSTQVREHHRFTANEYLRMAERGVWAEGQRVELIQGEIFDVTPAGSRHSAAVARLVALLGPRMERHAHLRVQDCVRMGELSVPEPDLAVVRHRDDFYAAGHPEAADVLLLVEVSDSSRGIDLGDKAMLYAQCGVPEYWVVDLTASEVRVLTAPTSEGYARVRRCARTDEWTSLSLPMIRLRGEDVLG